MDTEKEKNPAAVALGKLSAKKVGTKGMEERGRKGGTARALTLTPERRKEIARKAIETRWAKKRTANDITGTFGITGSGTTPA